MTLEQGRCSPLSGRGRREKGFLPRKLRRDGAHEAMEKAERACRKLNRLKYGDREAVVRGLTKLVRRGPSGVMMMHFYPATAEYIAEPTDPRVVRLADLMVTSGLKGLEIATGDSPTRVPKGLAVEAQSVARVEEDDSEKETTSSWGEAIWGWISSATGLCKEGVQSLLASGLAFWEWLMQLLRKMFGACMGFVTRTIPTAVEALAGRMKELMAWGQRALGAVVGLVWNNMSFILVMIVGGLIGFFSRDAIEDFAEGLLSKVVAKRLDLSEYTDAQAGKKYKAWVKKATEVATGDSPTDEPLAGFITLAASVVAVGIYGGITAEG